MVRCGAEGLAGAGGCAARDSKRQAPAGAPAGNRDTEPVPGLPTKGGDVQSTQKITEGHLVSVWGYCIRWHLTRFIQLMSNPKLV